MLRRRDSIEMDVYDDTEEGKTYFISPFQSMNRVLFLLLLWLHLFI